MRAVLTLGVLLACVACGGAGSSSGSPSGSGPGSASGGRLPGYAGPSLPLTSGPLPAAELGPAFERILCHALIECEGNAYPDVAACEEDREAGGLADVLDGIEDGSLRYDAAEMGECRRMFEANLCAVAGVFLFVPSALDVVQLCRATRGQRAVGEACRNGLECGSEAFCDRATSCPGICREKLAIGAVCSESEQCAQLAPLPDDLSLTDIIARAEELQRQYEPTRVRCEGDVCRATSMPGDPCPQSSVPVVGGGGCVGELTYCDDASARCVTRSSLGEPCRDDEQCEDRLWCDGAVTADDADGACAERSAAGGPCLQRSHCSGDLRCLERDATGRGRCGPRSSIGGPCELNGDCDDTSSCDANRCVARAVAGAPCDEDAECAAGLGCAEDAVCGPIVAHGQPCDATLVCHGVCSNGTCEPRGELGAVCTEGAECKSRDCAGGQCIDGELCANAQP